MPLIAFDRKRAKRRQLALPAVIALLVAAPAHASLFTGETLDAVADVTAWIALVISPVIGIGAFLMVHILPEKIAEKRHHPQLSAIKTLCLLSLFFGGMLWPIAWLWAYTKPVLHKIAYDTDVVVHEPEKPKAIEAKQELLESKQHVAELEERVRELQQRIDATGTPAHNGTGKFARWLHRHKRHEHGEEV